MSDVLKTAQRDAAAEAGDGFRPGHPETSEAARTAAAKKKFKLPAYHRIPEARIVVVPERLPGEEPAEYRARCSQTAKDLRAAAGMASVTVRWRTPGEHWVRAQGDEELGVVNRALAAHRKKKK